MKIYEITELHQAARCGDLAQVKQLLAEKPYLYKRVTPRSDQYKTDRDTQCQPYMGATVLHHALLQPPKKPAPDPKSPDFVPMVELLLKHPECKKIINIANYDGILILSLIVQIKDRDDALKLTKIALEVEHIEINQFIPSRYQMPPLAAACGSNALTMDAVHLDVVHLLLNQGADPNCMTGDNLTEPLLQNVALKLACNIEKKDLINTLMLLLIDHGADPQRRNVSGLNFFDQVIEDINIEPHIDSRIKERFQSIWKKSTPEEVAKAYRVYHATKAFSPLSPPYKQEICIDDTALLISMKRKQRLEKFSDFECTSINLFDFESFVQLALLRFQATKQSFQAQFVVTSVCYGNFAAYGQLNFDEQGHVDVFFVDQTELAASLFAKDITAITHKYFPNATIYATDEPLQPSEKGSHITAVYIAERLSAAVQNKKNLFGDLKKIDEETGIEKGGFRIIPWSKCPVYTGIPKIIQSVSAIKERFEKELEEDKEVCNKKKENYRAEMVRFFGKVPGDTQKINTKHESIRKKWGATVTEAYGEQFQELNAIQLASYTDMVNRIPVDALVEKLGITFKQEGEEWSVSLAEFNLYNNKGTLPELVDKFEQIFRKFVDDLDREIGKEQFLFRYAAIHACRTKTGILLQENVNTKNTQEKCSEPECPLKNRMM